MMRRPAAFGALLALLAAPSQAHAQLQVAAVRGVVRDAGLQPIVGAAVLLRDTVGSTVRSGATGPDGSFLIPDVAPGSYVLNLEVHGAVVLAHPLVIRGSLPVELTLQTGPLVHEEVVVRGDAGSNTAERFWSLAGDSVRRVSEPVPGQRVQSALSGLPGWTAEDNGLLHVRAVDDGILYVQDGIPIYERVDRLFGLAPTPSAIASLHVIDGYIPPEFGFKSGGVVEVRSETGVRDDWIGTVDLGGADFGTRHLNALAAGPLRRIGGLMITGGLERSARFLDPVDLDNLHNRGGSASAGAQWTRQTGPNLFTTSFQFGRSLYDVPHTLEQEQAGQDQRQRIGQSLISGTWQHLASNRTVWQVSAYRRYATATLYASPEDTPITADGKRVDERFGALWSVTHQRPRHTIKFGGEVSALLLDERFSFAIVDPDAADDAGFSEAAVAHDADDPFVFAERRRPSLVSGYVQDVFEPSDRLTLNYGVRFDSSRMLIHARQWSPRLGAAYRVHAGTVARASVQRLFQPPHAEYLLLGSSAQARALSPFVDEAEGGGADIPPERTTAVEGSISHTGAGWRVHAGAWRRRVRHVGDPNVFFGTTVTIPNSVARQHAWGLELRVDLQPRRGWSAAASYTHARIDQFGPITGGLFLEDEYLEVREGTRFTPDHDQRHALVASAAYAAAGGRWRLAGALRYQTGTPVGVDAGDLEELRAARGAEVVDFETGRVRPHAVADVQAEWRFHRGPRADLSLTAWVNNLANRTYAYNFGNPFSGTHFGAPRRAGVSVAARFDGVRP